MRVEVKYMKTYRFCYYFGKFFCGFENSDIVARLSYGDGCGQAA